MATMENYCERIGPESCADMKGRRTSYICGTNLLQISEVDGILIAETWIGKFETDNNNKSKMKGNENEHDRN